MRAKPGQSKPVPRSHVPTIKIAQPAQPALRRQPPVINNGQAIILVDGKPTGAAADVENAIRIRAINDANLLNNYGQIPQGEIGLLLEVKAEPKIQLQQILGVKIDKAIDNYDQTLTPTMVTSLIGNQADNIPQLMQMKQM